MPRRIMPSLLLAPSVLCLGVVSAWAKATPNAANDLTVVGWNVESGGTDPITIAGQLAAFDGVDLWGLSEVNDDGDAHLFENGVEVGEGSDFARILGNTGGGDRLLALYDTARFDLLGNGELAEINIGGNVRASLVLTLEERATGVTFQFMVNHLYRTHDAARHTQATLLNEWAEKQTLPSIAVGDYNFDYSVTNEQRDLGYTLMTMNDQWRWVRPATLVTTQCSGWPCAFNSVLDFVFVGAGATAWNGTAEIVVRDGDFPDNAATSDHRPVRAMFTLGSPSPLQTVYLPAMLRQPAATTPCSCTADTLNCTDFSTHTAAQACFNYCVSLGKGDIHRLDSDNDGVACESLPGGFAVMR